MYTQKFEFSLMDSPCHGTDKLPPEWWVEFKFEEDSNLNLVIKDGNDETGNDFDENISLEDAKALRDFLIYALADK